jgi:hypothetical protein
MGKIQPNKKQRTRRRSRTRFGRKIRHNLTRRTRPRQCSFIVPVPIDIMMPNRDRDTRRFQLANNPPQHLQQPDKPPLLNTDPVLRKQRIQVNLQRHLPLAPEPPQPPDLFLQRLPPFSAVSERSLRVGTHTHAAANSCCSPLVTPHMHPQPANLPPKPTPMHPAMPRVPPLQQPAQHTTPRHEVDVEHALAEIHTRRLGREHAAYHFRVEKPGRVLLLSLVVGGDAPILCSPEVAS